MRVDGIILDSLTREDIPALATIANNRKIWKNVRDRFPSPYKMEDTEQFIELHTQSSKESTFAIRFDRTLCGVCGIHSMEDVYRHTAEIGYWLGEPYWGKGIASAAVQILVRLGFQEMGLMRIQAAVFNYNPASMRVLEKNGFQLEGIMKKKVFKDGKFHDEHLYSLIKQELEKNGLD